MREILTIAESTWKSILKMKVVYFLSFASGSSSAACTVTTKSPLTVTAN